MESKGSSTTLIMDSDTDDEFESLKNKKRIPDMKFWRDSGALSGESRKNWAHVGDNEFEAFYRYFYNAKKNGRNLKAITITTNKKKIVIQDWRTQHSMLIEEVRKVFRYHSTCRYLMYFELNKSGNIHIHGIVDDDVKNWMVKLAVIGSRNADDVSHQPVKRLLDYFNYMIKDQWNYEQLHGLRCHHNFRKAEVCNSISLPIEGELPIPNPKVIEVTPEDWIRWAHKEFPSSKFKIIEDNSEGDNTVVNVSFNAKCGTCV